MRVGLISDTHDYLDPQALKLLAGVDHIIHGGDIGGDWIISELMAIAPVTVVLGNNDIGLTHRDTELISLDRQKILVHHIVRPENPSLSIGAAFGRAKPSIVVFGHTHQPYFRQHQGVWFVNPGYSGKKRFQQTRSVAIMTLQFPAVNVDFLGLGPS